MTGITNPDEEYFKDGAWGWDGTVWRKANLFLNYYDRYADYKLENDVPAGNRNLDMDPVPAGYVYVVTAASAYCTTGNPTLILLLAKVGGIDVSLALQAPVVAYKPTIFTGQLILKAGDFIRAAFNACVLNDDLFVSACGYKVKVT